jgi:hypothetical protein
MTFLRIGISLFFIVAPGVAYFSGMDPKIMVGLLVTALWGLISVAGEGALGLHHIDAYGPLSPYNDESDSELTTAGKVSGGIVGLLAALLLFLSASSYIKNKNKPPDPVPTSSPATSPTGSPVATPVATPDSTPVVVSTPDVAPTPEASGTPVVGQTPVPVASATPDDPDFEKLKLKAEEKVLSRDYKGATTILDDLEKQAPNDVDVQFFRFLTYQGLGDDLKAKEYADKILKDHPRSRYERRLDKFLTNLALIEKRKELGGDPTSVYVIDSKVEIELVDGSKLAESSSRALDEVTGAQIGAELLGTQPEAKPVSLPAGTNVTPMKSVHFFLNTGSGQFDWERSRNTAGATELDLVYVKVTSGAAKGKQGWLINNVKGAPSSEEKPGMVANNILGLTVIR